MLASKNENGKPDILKELVEKEVLLKRGAYKGTVYVLNVKEIG